MRVATWVAMAAFAGMALLRLGDADWLSWVLLFGWAILVSAVSQRWPGTRGGAVGLCALGAVGAVALLWFGDPRVDALASLAFLIGWNAVLAVRAWGVSPAERSAGS